jgi:pimeloyl-ACP methyl ester carboxylesterase
LGALLSATLALLPGLGADPRLFGPQKQAFPDLISIPWPEPAKDDTLPSYAARIVSLLPPADPLVVGGSSFGGMVALEISARIPVRAVILIGSCRSPRALAPWIRAVSPLARPLPASLLRPRHWGLGLAAPILGCSRREDLDLAWSMVTTMTPAFLKWGIQAVRSWRPGPVSVPVHHVHGARDRMIPLRGVDPDVVVPGAGHLLTLTHAAAVNAFLADRMRDLG